MEIKIRSEPDDQPDCGRNSYFTFLDGKRIELAGCALGGESTKREIEEKVLEKFGTTATIDWNGEL